MYGLVDQGADVEVTLPQSVFELPEGPTQSGTPGQVLPDGKKRGGDGGIQGQGLVQSLHRSHGSRVVSGVV